MKPERIQRRRAKGWKMPPNTIVVDRSTKWGNPFRPTWKWDKAYCAKLFEFMACGYICMSDTPTPEEQRAYLKMAAANLGQLRGKNLACWCSLGAPCHADTLLRWANQKRSQRKEAA